jgi:hypothetical protein
MPTENVAAGGKNSLILCRRSGVAFRVGEINIYPDIKPIEVRTVMAKKEASSEVPNLSNLAGYGGRDILIYTLMIIKIEHALSVMASRALY